jgi:hypothetical protein
MSERLSPAPREAPPSPGDEVVEVPLLLPGWQVSALASAAQDRGLTAGEMVRSLLRDFIATWQQHAHA